jgi:hypothetical protein
MGAPKDIDLGGVLVAPFVGYLFLASIILIAVRFVVGRLGLRSMFANPPLAEGATSASSFVSSLFALEDRVDGLSRFCNMLKLNWYF